MLSIVYYDRIIFMVKDAGEDANAWYLRCATQVGAN